MKKNLFTVIAAMASNAMVGCFRQKPNKLQTKQTKTKKLFPILLSATLCTSASAANWDIDWKNSGKYYDDTEKGQLQYFQSTMTGPGYKSQSTSFTELDGTTTLCVLAYEKSGFFSTKKMSGYFINLSKIEKIESLGQKAMDGDTLGVERYTLNDGNQIETLKFSETGTIYACHVNEKEGVVGKALKWKTFSSDAYANTTCAFDEEAASKRTFERQHVFTARVLKDRTETLGFNAMPVGYMQKIKAGAEAKASYDDCTEVEEKNRDYIRQHAEIVKSILEEYVAEHGDPVAAEMKKWTMALSTRPGASKTLSLAKQIGLPESNFAPENIGKLIKSDAVTLADMNMTYFGDYDTCDNAKYYTGDLSGVVINHYDSKALVCIAADGGLSRMDIKLNGSRGVFDVLNSKYKVVEKSINNGRTLEEANTLSQLYKRPVPFLPPYVDAAVFMSDDMVVKFSAKDVGEEYSRLSSRNYANLTYLTTPRFLKIKKARAEYNLNMAAEKWFKLKTAN